jgi:hypothetical protein
MKSSIRSRTASALLTLIATSLPATQAQEPDGVVARSAPAVEPVGLADWPALARALKEPARTEGRIVSFRELWAADPKLADEPVVVSGVVFRRFRREPVGQFPALEELWIRTDDDGLAVVTNKARDKAAEGHDPTQPGLPVRILAVFLRKIRYEAEDEPRIAPWLVAKRVLGDSAGDSDGASPGESSDATQWFVLIWATLASTAVLRALMSWSRKAGRRPMPDSGEFRDEASSVGSSDDDPFDLEPRREAP